MHRWDASFLVLCLCFLPHSSAQTIPPSNPELRFQQEVAAGIGASLKTGRSTSLSEAGVAANEFASYILDRTGHRVSPAFISRLADAEWRARAAGQGNIPIVLLAETVTRLFLERLGGPGAKAPVTAGSNPYYVITPEKLNAARLLYRRHVPQAVGSDLPENVTELNPAASGIGALQKAYPIEALVALYSCVSEDMGRAEFAIRAEKLSRQNGNAKGIPAGRKPYGDFGYFMRLPVSKLFAEDVLDQILGLAQ